MTDIVERAREYASSDHERGCQGRCYACSCGYDDRRDPLIEEMAAEIEWLRAAPIKALLEHSGFTDDEKQIAIAVVRAVLEPKP